MQKTQVISLVTAQIIEILFETFANPIAIAVLILVALVGVLIGALIIRFVLRPKNQIMYCRERDGRALDLDLGDEDAISFLTKSTPALRFYKYGKSYHVQKRGRTYARFLGKEGTGLTWKLKGYTGTKEKSGKGKPKEIELSFPTLEDAIKSKWGEQFYGTVPEEMQEILRENQLLVTVGLEEGLVPEGYEPITESIIEEKADEDMAAVFAEASKGITKPNFLFQSLPWMGFGAAIALAAVMFLGT